MPDLFAKTYIDMSFEHAGYIAGAGDGIVTVAGKPSSRRVYLLDALTMQLLRVSISLKNGHYLLMGLNPNKEYMLMVRDYKKEYEPFAWDYVKPSDDLTVAEQQALWQTWQ